MKKAIWMAFIATMAVGLAGCEGDDGKDGSTGPSGPPGTSGPTGPAGPSGPTGPAAGTLPIQPAGVVGYVKSAGGVAATGGTVYFVPTADVASLPATTVAVDSTNDEPLEDLASRLQRRVDEMSARPVEGKGLLLTALDQRMASPGEQPAPEAAGARPAPKKSIFGLVEEKQEGPAEE